MANEIFSYTNGSPPSINGNWSIGITNPTGSNVLLNNVASFNPTPPASITYGSTVYQFANAYLHADDTYAPLTDNANSVSNAQILAQFAPLRGDGPVADSDNGSNVTDVQTFHVQMIVANWAYDVEVSP
jgi:hypothetical protein